jgi:hypothetical protein
MRVRRKQLHAFDHAPRLVIEEPVLTRLKACYDRVSGRRRMLRCMLTRRTVTASNVPALRTAPEMKPPTPRRRQAFYTTIATRLRSGVDSAHTLFHFRFSFRLTCPQNSVKPPARSSRYHPFLPLLEPRPLH